VTLSAKELNVDENGLNARPLFSPTEFHRDGFIISTDKARLQLYVIHGFLANSSYWAKHVPLAVVRKAIANSLCFGVYYGDEQIGFARVISDYATFAYLADVFILPIHRGKALSKWLMSCLFAHPELQGLRRWMLATRDAHGLYAQYGFRVLEKPERFMELHDPQVYVQAHPGNN